MKKVLALVLAVMMVSTVAFAYTHEGASKVSSVNPGGSLDVTATTNIIKGATAVTAEGTSAGLTTNTLKISYDVDYPTSAALAADPDYWDSGYDVKLYNANVGGGNATSLTADLLGKFTADQQATLIDLFASEPATTADDYIINSIADIVFRDVTNENYSISSIRVTQGKSWVTGVTISDSDQAAQVKFVDDLNLTNPVEFDVSYTLRGKGKMVIKDKEELLKYILYTGRYSEVGKRVTIPSVKFTLHGKLGYGKVQVSLGEEGDQDIDTLPEDVDIETDVVEFKRNTDGVDVGSIIKRTSRAGSYVADAILTQEYDEGLTLEARVYDGDKLFFDVSYKPDRSIVGSLADHDGDLDFYSFTSQSDFIRFNSNAKLIFNDASEDDKVYKVTDGKLFPVGEYDEDEGCWIVKERTLGTYVISDLDLDSYIGNYIGGSDDIANPDTGANDVVGIATALAAVALVSAAAISLKK